MAPRLDHFGKQDASKGVMYKQNVGIFGRFEASRTECLGTLYKKSPKSEIQTSSDKATMKRFFSSGCCRKLAPKLPQACKVMCQREEAGEAGQCLTGPCPGLLRRSSVALSQIHQASSEREMVTGAGCCTGASLGNKGEKWKRGDRRNPGGIPAFSGFWKRRHKLPSILLAPFSQRIRKIFKSL